LTEKKIKCTPFQILAKKINLQKFLFFANVSPRLRKISSFPLVTRRDFCKKYYNNYVHVLGLAQTSSIGHMFRFMRNLGRTASWQILFVTPRLFRSMRNYFNTFMECFGSITEISVFWYFLCIFCILALSLYFFEKL